MDPIINRRIFFKIAATGVAGYFVSPMEAFSQTSATWTQNATVLGTAKNVIFVLLARSAKPIRHVRPARWSMDPRQFRADHD